MTQRDPKEIVRTFLEGMWSGNKSQAKSVFAENAEWWFPPSLGYASPVHPFEAIDIIIDDMIGRFDPNQPFEVELHHLIAEGDEVAAEYTATGVTSSGRQYKHRYLMRASVKDGRIVTVRPWADTKYFVDTLFGQ